MKFAPWIIAVVASVVAVGVLVWALNRGRNATRDLAREREERALQVAGLNVAHGVDRDALMNDLVAEATASAALSAELARIQAAAPGSKPIAVAHGGTGRILVGPAPGASVAPHPPADSPGTSAPVPASCPPCRLVAGDSVELRVSGAAVETGLGNVALAGVASAWRYPAAGGAPEMVVEGPLKLEVGMLAKSPPPGWGAGVVVVGGKSGWWIGPMASPPPIRLWGLEASLIVGAGVGGGGEWGGVGGGLLRW